MRLLILLALTLPGCFPERADRPLYYKIKLGRAEALYDQNDKALKALDRVNVKADMLSEDIRELYRLVVELRSRYPSSPSCSCSEDTE